MLFVACGCSTHSVLDLLPLVDGSNEVGPVVDTGTSDGRARDADCTDAPAGSPRATEGALTLATILSTAAAAIRDAHITGIANNPIVRVWAD